MCGIAGLWSFRGPRPASVAKAMSEAIRHRGPDGSGLVGFDATGNRAAADAPAHVHLGHQRLAILDLSDRGLQPMSGWKRWIVFNGEIYNYLELRPELSALGYRFESDSDTEVLLAAYDAWGLDCFRRLNGMWAFALYDPAARELICARDRMGVKPFYYWRSSTTFAFASEIKALLRCPEVTRTPNDGVIAEYLCLGLADHTPETFFEGIERLPPGHVLRLKADGSGEPRPFWALPSETVDATVEQSALRVHDTLTDAVRIRLRSDVAVGTCLSGGLDSSAVVSIVDRLLRSADRNARNVGAQQRTFTAGFQDARFDETAHARRIIAATAADAHFVTPDGERLWDEFATVQHHQDEPVQSSSVYAQYNVFRLVRSNGVIVTLDGQGADELFAGYPTYQSLAFADAVGSHDWTHAANQIRGARKLGGRGRGASALLGRAALGQLPVRVRVAVRRFRDRRIRAAMSARLYRVARERLEQREREFAQSEGSLKTRLAADLTRYSLPALLRYADRNSMAFAVESRMPFMDVRMVELAASLPSRLLVRDGWSKWIVREAMKDELPEATAWRRDKMGFVTPEVSWLRSPKLRALLSGPRRSADYQRLDWSGNDLDAWLGGQNDGAFYARIWRNINLELWLRAQ